jgi:Ca2+/Na+ antiporter
MTLIRLLLLLLLLMMMLLLLMLMLMMMLLLLLLLLLLLMLLLLWLWKKMRALQMPILSEAVEIGAGDRGRLKRGAKRTAGAGSTLGGGGRSRSGSELFHGSCCA